MSDSEEINRVYPVVTEGRLINNIFTGFIEDNKYSAYPVFTFDNGEKWQQDEPYYYYYGLWPRPAARVIKYGDNYFIIIDAVPEEINPMLPRPVKVKRV